MKKIFTLAATVAFTLGMNAQSVSLTKIDPNLANDYAGGCEIDVDNDGIKELIFGGSPNWNEIGSVIEDEEGNEVFIDSRATWLLKFDGTDYVAQQFSTKGVFGVRSHCIPADFNGDGNVDVYIASGGDANTLNGIYLNDGNGNYTRDESFKVLDEEGNAIEDAETGALRWLPRAIDLADFNNDGLIDIVSCGWWLNTESPNAMTGVLINNGNGTYTLTNRYLMGNEDEELAYAFALCTVKAYDLNNDGWMDFLVQGNVDNGHDGRAFFAFQNLGVDGPGEFYDLGLADGASRHFGNGNFNVVDFNNDGVADIFVTGENPDAHGGWAYHGQLLLGKIKAGEISYNDDQTFVARNKDIRPLNSNNVGTRAIDYNGDGLYDLFLLGWCESMLDGSGNTQSGWFLPGSEAGLVEYKRIPGASEQGIFFLDWGVEGNLNYTFTGYHADGNYFDEASIGRSMAFTMNPWTAAARPDAPTAPKAEVDGNTVTLSWTPAATSKNNVTYEYYLKVNGKIYNASTSFIGGDKDGVRKVLREGNACMNKTITLTLPDGTYEWGVQTVDAALKGSVFAKGENIVVGTGNGISDLVVSDNADAPVYNVAGQRVGESYKGIVIKNGKKVIK